MRNIFIILLILAGLQNSFAQRAPLEEIERNLVALEIFTGTWCHYCPGASMGADELIYNGYPVAVLEHHSGDDYSNVYSQARQNLYGINSYPNAFFDGIVQSSGGSNTESLYDTYVPLVNQRMEVLTPFSLDFTFTNDGDNQYSLSTDISKLGEYSSNVVLHIFVSESHIQEEWQGQTELNFVTRMMYPDANGTALDFSSSNNLNFEHTLSLDPSWNIEYSEFVIFIQDMQTKEVFNTAKAPVLQPVYSNDAAIKKLISPTNRICEANIYPEIIIKSFGSNPLQTLDIEYSLNTEFVFEYQWVGELGFLEYENVVLPEIPVSLESGIHNFEIRIKNPNNQEDGNEENNVENLQMEYISASSAIYMEAFLGTNAEDLSWELRDSDGNIIAQENYTSNNSGAFIDKSFNLEDLGCYELIWYDSYGDGFTGDGWCRLYSGASEFYYFESFEEEFSILWDSYGSEYLVPPNNASGIRTENTIIFQWSAPSKSTLLGYNIYQWPNLYATINEELIEEESYSYTTSENSDLVFFVSAVYEEGESDMSNAFAVAMPVSIEETVNNLYRIYPNPAKDFIKIESSQDIRSIVVINYLGQIVNAEKSVEKNQYHLNTTNLITGIYFVEIETASGIEKVKIIISD